MLIIAVTNLPSYLVRELKVQAVFATIWNRLESFSALVLMGLSVKKKQQILFSDCGFGVILFDGPISYGLSSLLRACDQNFMHAGARHQSLEPNSWTCICMLAKLLDAVPLQPTRSSTLSGQM
jgi:hypothetical protein